MASEDANSLQSVIPQTPSADEWLTPAKVTDCQRLFESSVSFLRQAGLWKASLKYWVRVQVASEADVFCDSPIIDIDKLEDQWLKVNSLEGCSLTRPELRSKLLVGPMIGLWSRKNWAHRLNHLFLERKSALDKISCWFLSIADKKGNVLRSYNLPVGAHLIVNEGDNIAEGKILVKIPRKSAKSGDITGGLPRVTELFEARNPSNPAVVSEIDGVVSFGKIKRGNREIIVESKFGDIKKYLVKLSNQILVQENDFIKAGMPLSDGSITPDDILNIKGPSAVQQYLVNEIQEVYRLQGVKINDKHFEVVVRQMMRKVRILDPGDTIFLENQLVFRYDFMKENDNLFGMKIIEEIGDSENMKLGQIVSTRQLRDENSLLKRENKNLVLAREVQPATAKPELQGITRASLQTKSFISAASFQETTKVLNEAAVNGKVDFLEGLKENVIVGHKIPAGTGLRDYNNFIVGSMEEYNSLLIDKEEEEITF